ncbi:MAG: InlB B-repeat-containing protein, partial [Muribaculaceae bacterium]|nr:InlB B-repeat-containing protein [Muribaculaceae bacterium]
DMSLYFKLADKDYEDLAKYEIGAFVDDECRGIAEKLELTEGESCLYMRIRSNESEGEAIDFLLRNKQTGDTVVLRAANGNDFLFKSGTRVGMPSDPFELAPYFNVSVKTEGKGSVDFTDGLYKSGTVINLTAVPAEGYHLESWSNKSTEASISFTVESDVEMTATFTPNIYKVIFTIDGVEVDSMEVACDAEINAPEAPLNPGYVFDGWKDLPETMPAHDLTITGSYSVKTYSAVFKVDGEVISSYQLEFGEAIPAPAVPEKTGYTFNGWGNLPETMPAHDIEMDASFTVNHYDISFIIGDEKISSSKVAFGTIIVAPEAPAKDGYTFAGWTDVPATMPAQNVEVKGEYAVNSYNLTFKIGEETVLASQLPFGAAISAPTAPALEGHSFSGWGDFPASMPAHDLEVSGSYAVNSYSLTFKIGEETVASENISYGSSIIPPSAPDKDGYTFQGWGDVPASMPAKDLVFNGSYAVNKYKLIFHVGEEELLSEELEYGAEVKAPAVPTKEGHTFSGWSEFPATMPNHNLDVLGTYVVNSYNISFKIGDEVILSEAIPFGTLIIAPSAPEKDGYSFTGWGDVPASMPAKDLAFTGAYEVNDFNVVYKIDGEVAYTAKGKVGEAVPAFAAPAKEGYTFNGWGEIPSVMPAQDLEFDGSYTINSYNLVFRAGEEIVFEGQLQYGAEISVPEAKAKEGHSFSGWGDVPATMPARDLVFESKYTANLYTVKFIVDEKEYQTASFEYGVPVVVPEMPEVEGHSFSGWGDVPATMPAFDIVLGGTYAENFYTVTYRIDGVVLFTDDVEYGTSISVPAAPEREGYTFNGWGDVPTSMPAYNLEYDGSYTVNTYDVIFKIGDEIVYSGSIAYGSEVVAPEVPVKEGHSFSGWGVVPATMPASPLEISGAYEPNHYNLAFLVDGNVFHSVSVVYGSELTAPEAPAREGHSFVGWAGLPATMPAADLVIDGTYSPNSYQLTFIAGEEKIFSDPIVYGTEISAPEAPAKEGHTFTGWGMVPGTMPASDLEIKGGYDVNNYTLTYLIDGQSFSTSQVAYGSALEAPEAPAKEGHSFVGWSDVPATMPASDLIVSGTYAVNSYNLVFKLDDEVLFEGSVAYGSEITLPEAPAKEGHSFTGWGMVPATLP